MPRVPRPARQARRRTAGALVIAGLLLAQACSPGNDSDPDATDPASYTLTPRWDNIDPGLPLAYDTDSHTVLAWAETNGRDSLRQIAAYDVRTGKRKWANAPKGWDVNVDFVVGDRMSAEALIIQSNYNEQPPAVAALRLDDGKVLWQLPTPGRHSKTAVAADVVVMEWSDTTLRAVDAADGRTRWKTEVEAGCRANEIAADEDLIVVDVVCEKKRRIESLDPQTGKPRWQHAVPPESGFTSGNVAVNGAAVSFIDRERLQILDRSGKVVLDEPYRNVTGPRIAATSDVAVAAYHDKDGKPTLTAVDLQDGKTRWSLPLDASALVLSGALLYAVGRPAAPLPQLGLYAISLATGHAAHSRTSLVGEAAYDTLVAVDQGMVVSYEFVGPVQHIYGHRLDAPTGEVGFAGGAPADAWPDSCSLLQTDELAAMASGAAYEARPRQTSVLDVILPRPALCRYEPPTIEAPVVTAAVAWVGTDEAQSTDLMKRLRMRFAAKRVPVLGDEAIHVVHFGEPHPTIEIYFRVGRCIGSVSLLKDDAAAFKLARLAAPRLCRSAGS
ncbi:PQQ-binding-like beta-propeller repeat protein [Catellatospora sichuanensis]|uniref:outer membrane protein assembly factor BamB family protein n=1 Tax=Catellatospora sichuanensis TaxID=1969805 RepID=UPI0016430E99|nr:PQQ-binding-like beta-propeller repeat protein [Catellatospora sichuanensis]